MKVVKKIHKCAVCGEENEYLEYYSNFISGYSDFDLKPIGSMMQIGENIMECPNCHYANYIIDDTIESRFKNNLNLWSESEEFQEIIRNNKNPIRKILLVAKQYENNLDFYNAYKSYIKASWIKENEMASEFRQKACIIFINNIMPNYRDNLLQIADLLRMEGDFDNANEIVCSAEKLVDDSEENTKDVLKIIDAEKNFITNKDNKRHNLGEIVNKENN